MWSKADPHARHGLTLARDRLEQARPNKNEVDRSVATAEAIYWLMLADHESTDFATCGLSSSTIRSPQLSSSPPEQRGR
jgi:hypothetical protein